MVVSVSQFGVVAFRKRNSYQLTSSQMYSENNSALAFNTTVPPLIFQPAPAESLLCSEALKKEFKKTLISQLIVGVTCSLALNRTSTFYVGLGQIYS